MELSVLSGRMMVWYIICYFLDIYSYDRCILDDVTLSCFGNIAGYQIDC